MKKISTLAAIALTFATASSLASTETITIYSIDEKGNGQPLGTLSVQDSYEGLKLVADLKGLKPGAHGIHIHENASCDPKEKDGQMVAGLAAGGHYDPELAGKHEGPKGHGHKGDLPPLIVSAAGTSKEQASAPRLTVADLKGRSIVIHEAGDNFSDAPKTLGGGGARIACGVVK